MLEMMNQYVLPKLWENEDNISRLKNVFWNTNTIDYKINSECDRDLKCKNILHININSKSKE